MPDKRALDAPDGDGDAKRVRSNNGSPAPPAPPAGALSDLDRKKQEAAARMAAVKAKLAASRGQNGGPASPAAAATPPPPPPAAPANDVQAQKAEAARKIAEMKARMAAQKAGGAASLSSAPQQQSQPQSDLQARIAEARARAAAVAAQRNSTPVAPSPPPRQDLGKGARGGLGIGLHPSLAQDLSKPADFKGKQGPKFGTTKGNQRPEPTRSNPYLSTAAEDQIDGRGDGQPDSNFDPTIAAKKSAGERKSKGFLFNQKGKFIAQANALRQQAKLEEMKRRIAAETRKAEIEEASDKAYLVPAPPDVEWWDECLLPEGQNSYEDWDHDDRNRIRGEGSIITVYVQHPVLLQPPQDKFMPAPKPMMLTPKEQKKIRRQRRMADNKEEQAKIRLGLVEPPPPKVKKSNMMRVLGEQAVKDPTAVEARVNREIAQRQADHEQANEDRKLTKEQRQEKLARQQQMDEAKGVKIAVFKVHSLSSGKHRYQVDINAKQQALTGIVVLHPTMNLVIVEGGVHSINDYKKLMLQRIKWQENTLPLSNTTPTTFTGRVRDDGKAQEQTKEQHAASTWLNPTTEVGELRDLAGNGCVLVWEGGEMQRRFKKWGSRVCETDGEARDVLSKSKMENMWQLARSMVAEG